MKKIQVTVPTVALLFLITGCGEKPSETTAGSSSDKPAAAVKSLESYFLAEAPGGAVPVSEVRKQFAKGRVVTVSGQVGGTVAPFTEGYATFVMADEALMYCDEMGDDDHCKTPWDACCEDVEKVAAARALVQLVGEDGRPLRQGLEGVRGLAGLDHVVVTGSVAEASSPENLIINAKGIFRRP